jgi:hypothetical protein
MSWCSSSGVEASGREPSKERNTIRLAGAVIGAIGAVVAVHVVSGAWGFAAGGGVFLACASISDRLWRRRASREEIRRDLEDRARDTLP